MIEVNKQLQEYVINHNGRDRQVIVCMEEPSELIQAITKVERAYQGEYSTLDARYHLAEEMCDVYICLEQLKLLYGIDDGSIQEWIEKKEERQRGKL